MAKRYPGLVANHIDFIESRKLFFVASAACGGKINLSPKGMDTLRVLGNNRAVWMNLTGSGNETAAHLLDNRRMTLMFCSFELNPLILRLYGTAETVHLRDAAWPELKHRFPPRAGARQIFDMHIELVQTSCGFAVPLYEYAGERDSLRKWAEKKGEEGVSKYWAEKNRTSLDGKATGIVED